MKRLALVLALGAGLCPGSARASPPGDPCEASIPQALRDQVKLQWPDGKLPREEDNLAGDIDYHREQGGSGCLGVAEGDFDGNGQMDVALLLTFDPKRRTLLIAALRFQTGWRLECVRIWEAERSMLYVNAAPPGRYSRFSEFEGPPTEPGELEVFESKTHGFETGWVESTGICYFKTENGWVHIWVSD